MKTLFSLAVLHFFFLIDLSGATTGNTTNSTGTHLEGRIGARIFGYQGMLKEHYGNPPGLSISTRLGPATGKWSIGLGYNHAWLDNHVFDEMYFFNGGMNLANVQVTQNNHLLDLDMRYNFFHTKRMHPFIDTGLGLTWVRTRISLHEANVPDREIAHIDTYPIHSDSAPLLSIGIGKRIKLFRIEKNDTDDPRLLKNFAFLDIKVGYNFGGSMSYVNGTADWMESIGVESTSHSLYDRPIESTSVNSFYIGLTYGISMNL